MSDRKYTYEFLTSEHKSMLDDMNHISNQLKGFYWYLLATIGSLGIAYKCALGVLTSTEITSNQNVIATLHSSSPSPDNKLIIVMLICFIGNLILWTICEYAISHGFLFRFIQTKTAKIEQLFNENTFCHFISNPLITLKKTLRDPSLKEQYFKDCSECKYKHEKKCQENETCLLIDHLLPDQFIPIYWGCLMLLFTNMVVLTFILSIYSSADSNFIKNGDDALYWAGALSFPFIWKILTYYMYKTEKFISSTCEFKILQNNIDSFFRIDIWFKAILIIIAFIAIIVIYRNQFHFEIMLIPIGIFYYYSLPIFFA